MGSIVIPRWIRRPASEVASRREALAAGFGGLIAAVGLACDDHAVAGKGGKGGKGGKNERCLKIDAKCGGGKKCCSNRCCSGYCADEGASCCSKQHNEMRGWCDKDYPVCCPEDIVKGGGCCLAEYSVCCPPTSWEPDGYCCAAGTRCVDSAARCELKSGGGPSHGTRLWMAFRRVEAPVSAVTARSKPIRRW